MCYVWPFPCPGLSLGDTNLPLVFQLLSAFPLQASHLLFHFSLPHADTEQEDDMTAKLKCFMFKDCRFTVTRGDYSSLLENVVKNLRKAKVGVLGLCECVWLGCLVPGHLEVSLSPQIILLLSLMNPDKVPLSSPSWRREYLRAMGHENSL